MHTTHFVDGWAAAQQKAEEMAGDLPLYYGTGNPIRTPHATASTLDAWSGEGMGYFVTLYPEGDRYDAPRTTAFVRIGNPPPATTSADPEPAVAGAHVLHACHRPDPGPTCPTCSRP